MNVKIVILHCIRINTVVIKDLYRVFIPGRGGQKIRELEEKSNARIKVLWVCTASWYFMYVHVDTFLTVK